MGVTDCPLCWVEAHIGNPGDPGHPLKPTKIKKTISKKVERLITPEARHFGEEAAKLDNWLYHKRLTEYFGKEKPSTSGNPSRLWNDAEIYWLEQSKLFGKPIYDVRRGHWAKPAARFLDKKKAEKYRDEENAYTYLQSKIEDRKFLIGIAEKVGLTEDELEGFSNASVMGEILGAEDFKNIARELAENISSNPGNPCPLGNPCLFGNPSNPGTTQFEARGATLPGRQMWLLRMMCLKAGIDTMHIDSTITYWENKNHIEELTQKKLRLGFGKSAAEREEARYAAAMLREEKREEEEAYADYLRYFGKNH